jgi:hypothetical protein
MSIINSDKKVNQHFLFHFSQRADHLQESILLKKSSRKKDKISFYILVKRLFQFSLFNIFIRKTTCVFLMLNLLYRIDSRKNLYLSTSINLGRSIFPYKLEKD